MGETETKTGGKEGDDLFSKKEWKRMLRDAGIGKHKEDGKGKEDAETVEHFMKTFVHSFKDHLCRNGYSRDEQQKIVKDSIALIEELARYTVKGMDDIVEKRELRIAKDRRIKTVLKVMRDERRGR
jgi:hypothetical protein